jgi:hypothetical protein
MQSRFSGSTPLPLPSWGGESAEDKFSGLVLFEAVRRFLGTVVCFVCVVCFFIKVEKKGGGDKKRQTRRPIARTLPPQMRSTVQSRGWDAIHTIFLARGQTRSTECKKPADCANQTRDNRMREKFRRICCVCFVGVSHVRNVSADTAGFCLIEQVIFNKK